MTDELQKRLQKLQNACVRYVCGVVRKREHITPYRKKLDWLDIKRKRSYFVIVQMYKTYCMSQLPPCLAEIFEKYQSRSLGRVPRELSIPGSRSDVGVKSFTSQGARLWNALPSDIRNLPSLAKFKSALRKHMYVSVI